MVNSIQERSKDLINMKNVSKSILKREEQPSFAEKWNQDSCILKKSWRKPLLCIQKISSPPFRPLYSALLYNILAGLMKRLVREVVFTMHHHHHLGGVAVWGRHVGDLKQEAEQAAEVLVPVTVPREWEIYKTLVSTHFGYTILWEGNKNPLLGKYFFGSFL